MRVAIMQPYFMPYAGYFRLMAAADLFVFYDCVQFPRRGWVHRNKLTHQSGAPEWLTLPLAKGDRDLRILDLQFADGAQSEWEKRMAEFPVLRKSDNPLLATARELAGTPCDYLIRSLRKVASQLGMTCKFERSSTLNLPDSLHAQDRILAIAEHYGAKTYINPPGGRELYQDDAFAAKNIELQFLPDYKGNLISILERLLTEPADAVAQEIRANL